MKKKFIFHPFLFALYFPLFIFSCNADQILFYDFAIPTLILVLSAVIYWKTLRFFIPEDKTPIITSISLLIFFSYGHFYSALNKIIFIRHRWLLSICVTLFAAVVYFVLKRLRNTHKVNSVLNLVSSFLVTVSLFITVIVYGTGIKEDFRTNDMAEKMEYSGPLPDIYYIILDAYANPAVLKELFDYDNSDFIDYLEKSGFYVAYNSKANYPMSHMSIASSLNMNYIDCFDDVTGEKIDSKKIPYQMIRDNYVSRILRSKGYAFVNICSGWSPTDNNPYADRNIQFGRINEFSKVLIQTTMLRRISNRIIAWDRRRRVLGALASFDKINMIGHPKFVFAHIVAPHRPFIFDKDGSSIILEEDGLCKDEYKRYYTSQLAFIASKAKELIGDIISKSRHKPIIIMQSDHGPGLDFKDRYEEGQYGRVSIWEDTTKKEYRERVSILNAYYLPESCREALYDFITPVNSFRLVFDRYFGMDYGLLEDKVYWPSPEKKHIFIDITGDIEKQERK